MESDDVQAMIKIFAKSAFPHVVRKLAIGSSDEANIERVSLRSANALKFALLQDAQELGLQPRRQFADFVSICLSISSA